MAVPALVPAILNGLVVPKLRVGGCWAFAGPAVTAAVSTMLPVKPPTGVKVVMDVFSVVAPGATETAVPLTVKVGMVILTDAVPDALL